MKQIVTFDLDSTLADTRHRHHLIKPDGNTDWEAYAHACPEDTLIAPVFMMWNAFWAAGFTCAIVTIRNVSTYDKTMEWLLTNGISPAALVMGTDADATSDHGEAKVKGIKMAEGELRGRVVLHVDDYAPVAEALAPYGIPCLVVTSPQRIESPNFASIRDTHV